MNATPTRSSFWTIGLSGLLGAAIGASGVFFSQKQAVTEENQFYMEMDLLRLSIISSDESLEERLKSLRKLEQTDRRGFRMVFKQDLKDDIQEYEDHIERISQEKTEKAAEIARAAEEERAEAAAQESLEEAMRTNPYLRGDVFIYKTW